MTFPKNFLWGGALAAHQFEGGVLETSKGLSVADVMTAGAHGIPRVITNGVIEGNYYPNHIGIDFYHCYKEDIALLQQWALNALEQVLLGLGFFQRDLKQNLKKKDYSFTMRSLMNC